VGIALSFERRGYTPGKTEPAPLPVGLLAPAVILGLTALYLAGGVLAGPPIDDMTAKPPHAPWLGAFGIALVAGALLSLTGFCAITAGRQVFAGPRPMLWAALALIAGFGAALIVAGRFAPGLSGQPLAHGEVLWNALALGLLGLGGALAGGCPVRQVVMSGEGNGDAFVCVAGIALGGAIAHNFGLVSAPATAEAAGGTTVPGRIAIGIGWAFCLAYAAWIVRASGRTKS
jgi:YedE family putative selenium metabolism protein